MFALSPAGTDPSDDGAGKASAWVNRIGRPGEGLAGPEEIDETVWEVLDTDDVDDGKGGLPEPRDILLVEEDEVDEADEEEEEEEVDELLEELESATRGGVDDVPE